MSALIYNNNGGSVTSLDQSPPSLIYPPGVYNRPHIPSSHIAQLPKKKSNNSSVIYPMPVHTDSTQPQSMSNLSRLLLDSKLRSAPSPTPSSESHVLQETILRSNPIQAPVPVKNSNRLPPHHGFRSSHSVPVSAQTSPAVSPSSSPADDSTFVAEWLSESMRKTTRVMPIDTTKYETYDHSRHYTSVDDCELIGKAGDSGTNTAYLVRVNGRLSIFKPVDGEAYEEQRAVSQPLTSNACVSIYESSPACSPACSPDTSPIHSEPESPVDGLDIAKLSKTPMRKGIVYGDSVLKEKASFVLDSPDHFSGVPYTDAVRIWFPRDTEDLPVVDPTTVVALEVETSSKALSVFDSSKLISMPASKPIAIPTPIRNSQSLSSIASISKPVPNNSILASIRTMDQFIEPSNSPVDNSKVEVFGSLQDFVPHIGSADDVGSGLFPADEVHRIGILDIRLLNLDRHLGNMLVRRDENGFYHLTPIDHGYALPSYNELSDVHLEWTYWKQAAIPFSITSLKYIASLNPLQDMYKLRKVGIRTESILSMVFSTLLLQRCAAIGFTLQQIALLVQRSESSSEEDDERNYGSDPPKTPSFLERVVARFLSTTKVHSNHVNIDGSDPGFSPLSSPVASAMSKVPFEPLSLLPSSPETLLQIDASHNIDSDDNIVLMLQSIVEIIDQELSIFKTSLRPLAVTQC